MPVERLECTAGRIDDRIVVHQSRSNRGRLLYNIYIRSVIRGHVVCTLPVGTQCTRVDDKRVVILADHIIPEAAGRACVFI